MKLAGRRGGGEAIGKYLEYDKMFGGYCKKTETLKAEWHDRFRQ